MNWPTARLEDCTRIVGGATPSTDIPDYWDGDIWWTTPKDLSDLDGIYLDATPRTITDSGLGSCAAEILPAGSVLFSSRAPIGHVAINRVPVATNQGFKSFIPKRGVLSASYLLWWLKTNRAYLESLGNGATFKELSKAAVGRIEIPLPPLTEQNRIAAILDRADDLRRKRRITMDRLDALVVSTFVGLFGDPADNPKGWPRIPLGELIDSGPQNGLYKPSSDYGSGTPILRIDAFYDGLVTDIASLKRVRVSPGEKRLYGLRTNDIVINRVNSLEYLGKSALITGLPEDTIFESNMMRFNVRTNIVNTRYLIQFLQNPFVKSQIATSAKKAVNQASINQKDVCSFLINVPDFSSQQVFERHFEAIQKLRSTCVASSANFDNLFASLQHLAFNGELTATHAERELAEAG